MHVSTVIVQISNIYCYEIILLNLGTDDRGDSAVAVLGLEDVDDALIGLPGGAALGGGVEAGLDGLPDLLLGVHNLLWLLLCKALGIK